MADAPRDSNRVTTLLGTSNVNGTTPVVLWADPSTHALLITGTITVDTTGLATSAKQDTIISHLDGVEGLLTTIDTDTGNIATSTSSIDSKIPTLGQALAAASVPVVLTASQLTTLTPPPAITGFATSAKQDTIIGHVDGIETSLTSIDGKITAVNTGAVVVSSSALPTGASTSAKQPALGTAGTASADVITVQGITSMTPLKVDGSAVTQPVSLTSTTVTGTVAVTQSGTWDEVGINDSGNSITVDYATTGSGTATGALRVELPTNGTGTVGLNAGTNAIGKLAANSGVDIGDVDVTSISAGTNLIGDVDIQPRTTGGWSVGNFTSGDTYTALTGTAQAIKASAGKFGGYYIYNPNTSATYVLIYNIAAASVTVGTSTAKLVFCIPASSGANLELLAGIPFDTAMSIAATTTGGGSTAPTTALEAMIFYK